jgi:hypothetical protein
MVGWQSNMDVVELQPYFSSLSLVLENLKLALGN